MLNFTDSDSVCGSDSDCSGFDSVSGYYSGYGSGSP